MSTQHGSIGFPSLNPPMREVFFPTETPTKIDELVLSNEESAKSTSDLFRIFAKNQSHDKTVMPCITEENWKKIIALEPEKKPYEILQIVRIKVGELMKPVDSTPLHTALCPSPITSIATVGDTPLDQAG